MFIPNNLFTIKNNLEHFNVLWPGLDNYFFYSKFIINIIQWNIPIYNIFLDFKNNCIFNKDN